MHSVSYQSKSFTLTNSQQERGCMWVAGLINQPGVEKGS